MEKFSNRTFESLRNIKFLPSKQDLERGGRENSPRLRMKRKKESGGGSPPPKKITEQKLASDTGVGGRMGVLWTKERVEKFEKCSPPFFIIRLPSSISEVSTLPRNPREPLYDINQPPLINGRS